MRRRRFDLAQEPHFDQRHTDEHFGSGDDPERDEPDRKPLAVCREEWRDEMARQYYQAEADCHGVLLRRSMEVEFTRKFGSSDAAMIRILFRSSMPTAVKYASEELQRWWDVNGRIPFWQWALAEGYRHRFMLEERDRSGTSSSRLVA